MKMANTIQEDCEEEDESYQAILHDEHVMESKGIQAPKYNKTKHNKIDKLGPRQYIFQPSLSISDLYSDFCSESMQSELCIICYDNIVMEDVIKVLEPCNHYYHTNCIN